MKNFYLEDILISKSHFQYNIIVLTLKINSLFLYKMMVEASIKRFYLDLRRQSKAQKNLI